MKFRKTRLLSLLMAAALVFESAGMNVVAAPDISGNDAEVVVVEEVVDATAGDVSESDVTAGDVSESDISDGDVSANDVEEPVVDVTEGDVSDGDVTDGDVSEGNVTDGDVTDGDVTEGDVSEGDVVDSIFPGLPVDYVFSEAQLAAKAELADYAADIAEGEEIVAGESYVEGEVVYLTDSEEDALLVAAAFGGELESYAAGVAVITLAEEVTVVQAVCAAADDKVLLPAVWPNYIKEYYAYGYEQYDDPALFDYLGGPYQWQHKFVGSYYAWEAGYTGSGVNVAIVDSGALGTHADLSARLKKNVVISTDGSTVEDTTTDPNGHGTHVAGIAAASIGNDVGGAGIAPNANLYVYSVGNSSGSIYTDAALRAINLAIADGADVLNMSYGSGFYDGNENAVMQNAYQNGVALFAAAGNDSAYNVGQYPASYSNVCSIASLQADGKQSSFSNTGSTVDLAFPGSDIYSTTKDGSFGYMSGTSMASPVATGVAAVILSGAADIPELAGKTGSERVDALFQIMEDNAMACSSKGTGAGTTYLPDVFDIEVDDWDTPLAAPTFSVPSGTVFDTYDAYIELDCANKLGVEIFYTVNGKTPTFKNGKLSDFAEYYDGDIWIGGQKKVTIKAIAIDYWTGKCSKVATATYTFKPIPTNVYVTAANNVDHLLPGKSLQLKAEVWPNNPSYKKVTWSVTDETKAAGVSVSKSGKVTVTKTATPGNYYITATAVDNKGKALYYNGSPVEGLISITVVQGKEIKSVKFSQKTANVDVYNDYVNLDLRELVTVTYADGTTATGVEADLAWTTSKNSVAGVSEGIVTAWNPGKTTIKAISNDGSNKSASITVVVKQKPTDLGIYSEYYTSVIAPGKSIKMYANIFPYGAANAKVNWSVAPVSESYSGKLSISKAGKLSADKKASGTWRVTATTADMGAAGAPLTATWDITVAKSAVKSITMDKTMEFFIRGDDSEVKQLDVKVDGPADTPLYFWTDNDLVVYVNSETGVIDGYGAGTANVYCKALDGSGKTAKCKVTVKVPMSSLTIVPADNNDGIAYVGSSMKLTAVAGTSFGIPSSKKVKWTVDEACKDMISISSSGVVKAKSLGKGVPSSVNAVGAIVYAEATDGSGLKTSYAVTVVRKLKKLNVKAMDGVVFVTATLDNGAELLAPYTVSVTTPKNAKVSIVKYDGYFGMFPEEPTTTKESGFTKSDALKITAKVKLQGTTKTASASVYIVRTPSGGLYYIP